MTLSSVWRSIHSLMFSSVCSRTRAVVAGIIGVPLEILLRAMKDAARRQGATRRTQVTKTFDSRVPEPSGARSDGNLNRLKDIPGSGTLRRDVHAALGDLRENLIGIEFFVESFL